MADSFGPEPGSSVPAPHASSHAGGGSDAIPTAVSGGAAGLMSGADKAAHDAAVAAQAAAVTSTAGGAGNAGKLAKLDAQGKLDGRVVSADGTKLDTFAVAAGAGAILYDTGAGYARLPPDTEGKFLATHGAAAPTWETPGGATRWSQIYHAAAGGTIFPFQVGRYATRTITYLPYDGTVAKGDYDHALVIARGGALTWRIRVEWGVDTTCTLYLRKRATNGTWSDGATLSLPTAGGAAQSAETSLALADGEGAGLWVDTGGGATFTHLRIFEELT